MALSLVLVGCGGSSADSPIGAVRQWVAAVADHDGGRLCELSTAARQARQLNFAHLSGGSSCADGENKLLEFTDRIDRLSHVKPTLIHESKTRAEVEAGPGSVIGLEMVDGHWYISKTTEEEGEIFSG
jgi:hypothetical protein